MNDIGLSGWESLRHGGLLLDTQRQLEIAECEPEPLPFYLERDLRRLAPGILEVDADVPAFVTFILEKLCGFTEETGSWKRGSKIPAEWGRRAITGEMVKPHRSMLKNPLPRC